MAESNDADRPLSAVDTPSSRLPLSSLSTSSASRKKMDQGCRKDHRIPEFSGVLSATHAPPAPTEVIHGHCHHGTTATSGPRADSPATDPRPDGPASPLPQRHHRRRISASPTPAGPCPHTPHHYLGCTESGPQPGRLTYRASPPAPSPCQFSQSMDSPTLHGQRSSTAAQYSNAADQHRPTTPTTDQ